MDENLCDEIAHRVGFRVPVGNWVTPDGALIAGESYDTHHWETIKQHLNVDPEPENYLKYMNDRICEGYIRIVIRLDVLFQVPGETIDVVWSNQPNFLRMKDILSKLGDTEIHIFSKKFYIIGSAIDICNHTTDRLQIKQ